MKKLAIIIFILIFSITALNFKRIKGFFCLNPEKISTNVYSKSEKIFDAVYYPNSKQNIYTYTVSTEYNEGLACLIESMKDKKMPLQVLGLGRKWSGFGNKYQWLEWYLEQQDIPDDGIFLFIDGHDVVILADQEEIIQKYLKFDTPIVCSGDKICWPDASLAKEFPIINNNSTYKFVNSGTYIGTVKAIKEAYKEMKAESTDDDQFLLTK